NKIIMHKFFVASKKLIVFALVTSPLVASATFTPIVSQLEFGNKGTQVVDLQTFLAANPSIYREGFVTGYYGPLTEKAVKNFQSFYGISPVGRVGPITVAKINELIMQGLWGFSGGVDNNTRLKAPMFTSVNSNIGRNSATFIWSTDEIATARIFYDRDPVKMNWGDIDSSGLTSLSGLVVNGDGQLSNTQTLTVNNLQPNTVYHYIIVSTDVDGNVSVWGPNNSFRTNP
ncbi:MAG: hypothetical protein QG653_636, partial [Patescibacteria group bacterium]|nr:hypothetical protein [Patescibacteria group bacterium]